MQYIYLSDIHGSDLKWVEKIEQLQRKHPKSQLVFGGDYIDGGSYSKETLEYIQDQMKISNAITLLGNHEEFMIKTLQGSQPDSVLWFYNGGFSTVTSLLENEFNEDIVKDINLKYPDLLSWLLSLNYSYTTENICFVHAGLDFTLDDPVANTRKSDMLWIREEYIYSDPKKLIFAHNPIDKVIFTGHTPTSLITGYYENSSVKHYVDKTNPVLEIKYPGEKPRIFADGGAHSLHKGSAVNVLSIDEFGNILDIL